MILTKQEIEDLILEAFSKIPEELPIAKRKIQQLIEQGGEHIRDAKIIRMPDGSECCADVFGAVNWITNRTPAPQTKVLWSPNGEDLWEECFELIDQDLMFFDDKGVSVVYRSNANLISADNLISDMAIEEILESISFSGQESRQDHDHYIPEDWLETFASKESTKQSLKELIVKWLVNQGQADLYTVDESTEVDVKLVGDELIEIEAVSD